MDIESYRAYCLSLHGVTEGFPFDQNTLVFKVGGKMFALVNLDYFKSVNLKCDPEYALELRAENDGIIPGFHMNKKHWNTVSALGEVSDQLLLDLTVHSYQLVFNSLSKKKQLEVSSL